MVRNYSLGRICLIIRQAASEEGTDTAGVCPLFIETKLDNVGRVEIRAGGIIAVLVHGQLHGQFPEGIEVPFLAVIQFTDLVRWVRKLSFVKRLLVIEDEGGEQSEGDTNEH